MEKKKYGWTALGIVGFIFAPIGLLFTVLGAVIGRSPSVSWQGPDDPAVFLAVFCSAGRTKAATASTRRSLPSLSSAT